MKKRQFTLAVYYLSVALGTATFIYCAMRLWSNAGHSMLAIPELFEGWGSAEIPTLEGGAVPKYEISMAKKVYDSFLSMQSREREDYEHLIQYILYPQTSCDTSEVFGGIMYPNKLLDGDKVLCLEPGLGISKQCIVYSFGISYEWSFEEAIQRKFGCNIYAHDPSMADDDYVRSPGVWFYRLGIGKFDGKKLVGKQEWNIRTFRSILQKLGHQNKTIDILKIDIEGDEFDVLEDMLETGMLNRVNHLCIEIHLQSFPYWSHVLKLLLRIEAEAGLRLFSTRNNTQVPPMRVPGFHNRYEQFLFELAWYRH